jgi:CsoR family transcriptional regulator, copper-sensing transcriptional repressor
MAITSENKQRLKSRLAKAIGHLNAVHKMVDDERYCIDVLTQLKAVQSALDKTAQLMLHQHLNTCVVEAVKADDSKRVMDELWQLLRKSSDTEEIIPESHVGSGATKLKKCCGENPTWGIASHKDSR